MDWRIEMVSSRGGEAFEWTITKGVNLHSDGPEATVCKVTSSARDAALIAAAPDMYKMLVQLQLEGGLVTARHRQIDRLMAKARGEN
jgi:hypothetical protein